MPDRTIEISPDWRRISPNPQLAGQNAEGKLESEVNEFSLFGRNQSIKIVISGDSLQIIYNQTDVVFDSKIFDAKNTDKIEDKIKALPKKSWPYLAIW